MQHAAISRPKPLIVAHLLLLMAEQPRHGYDLAASLRTWEFEGVTPSMVYRDLARLETEGVVRSVEVDGVMALVEIEAGPFLVTAAVTRDSVEELGLAPGVHATAAVKATSVMVSR
mgnify:CR=1 FL=1